MSQSDIDAAARETLRLIGPDPQNWVPDLGGVDHNVAVIGGGQSGSAFAFALRRAGVGKVTVIDAAQDAASDTSRHSIRPWTTARSNSAPVAANRPSRPLGHELFRHTVQRRPRLWPRG